MHIKMDVFLHADDLSQLLTKVNKFMATLDDVVSKLAALSTAADGIISLLNSKQGGGIDSAKLQDVVDAIGTLTDKINEAIAANTPAP
jgi:flagellar basal body P-ring protein FlgI